MGESFQVLFTWFTQTLTTTAANIICIMSVQNIFSVRVLHILELAKIKAAK